MARVNLRPDDMALLAQRFDGASEEFRRSARRLDLELDHVALNPVDDAFAAGRFRDRSALARARLRQLSDETGVDAGLLSTAAYGGEFSNDHQWLRSLQVLVSGWGSLSSLGSVCSDVVHGLAAVVGSIVSHRPRSASAPAGSGGGVEPRPVLAGGPSATSGGLFAAVSAGGDGSIASLGGRLGGVAGERPSSPDWSRLWNRINNDLDDGDS